jgi:hypothetical protein
MIYLYKLFINIYKLKFTNLNFYKLNLIAKTY